MSKTTVNKILSIGLAIFLWIVVIGGENPIKDRTIHSVPVVLNNLDALADSNLAIAGDTDYTVDVKIKGQRTVVDPLTVKDIKVEADLFGYGKGQNYINVTATIPDNTELVEIRSPKIQVILEDLIAVSKPVNISFRNVPDGKEVGGLVMQPTGVEVSGAQSLVDSVAWAFGTVNTDDYVEGQKNTAQVELQPLNDGEALVENVKMSSQYADVTYVLMDVKEVPLRLETEGQLPVTMTVKEIQVPETIKIRGLAADLAEISEVVAGPVDIAALELNETFSAETMLEVQLPEGVELSRDNTTVKAVFQMKEVSAEAVEFGGTEIEIRNLPEEMEGTIEPGMYTVTVKADAAVLEEMEKEDIQLYVDASTVVEDGVHSLPVKASYTKEFDEVLVIPEMVEVQIVDVGER